MIKNRRALIVSLILMGAVLGLASRDRSKPDRAPADSSSGPKTESTPSVSPQKEAVKNQPKSLSFEALSAFPNEDLADIQKKAQDLNFDDLQMLKKKALDVSINQDERFFATFLMSQSSNEKNLMLLFEMVQSPFDENIQNGDFERVLRAQALEAMLINESSQKEFALGRLSEKIQDRFLLDRVARTRYALHHPDRTPEIQDLEALRKLLKSERSL